MIIQFGKKSK